MNFDWKQFYLSAQGRVNRKQFWLRLVLPSLVISIVLLFIDMAIGTFNAEDGVGLLSGIFSLVVLIPAILVYIKRYQALARPRQVRMVDADPLDPHRRRHLAPGRARLPRRHAWAESLRSAAIGLMGTQQMKAGPHP